MDTETQDEHTPAQNTALSRPPKRLARFYEGYEFRDELDPATGKVKQKRVYTGTTYTPQGSKADYTHHKVSETILSAMALVIIVFGATRTVPSNILTPLVIPQAAGLFGLLYHIYLVIQLWAAPYPLTVWYYRRCSGSLRRNCLFCAVCFAASALIAFGAGIAFREIALWGELVCGLAQFAGAALFFAVYWLEARTTYTEGKGVHA